MFLARRERKMGGRRRELAVFYVVCVNRREKKWKEWWTAGEGDCLLGIVGEENGEEKGEGGIFYAVCMKRRKKNGRERRGR